MRGYFDWLGWFTKWMTLVFMLGICMWLVTVQLGLAGAYLMIQKAEGGLTDSEYAYLDARYDTMAWSCFGAWLLFVVAGPIFIGWYGRRKSRVVPSVRQ